jgi:arylsulfatase A-like enzyme
LVIFTSDNGPWLSYGHHAGSAVPLREGKGTSFEGGVRVPTLMRWPDRIPAGTRCDAFAATIDVLPTVAHLIGADSPELPIDGLDISDLLFSETPGPSPHNSYFIYFADGELQAVRDGRWKLMFPHRYRTLEGKPGGQDGSGASYSHIDCGKMLFDLEEDPAELRDVLDQFPAEASRLCELADTARQLFGDRLTDASGSAIRGPGRVE